MVDRAMVVSSRGLCQRAVTPRSEEVVVRFARPGRALSVAISPPSTAVSSVNSNFSTAVIGLPRPLSAALPADSAAARRPAGSGICELRRHQSEILCDQ